MCLLVSHCLTEDGTPTTRSSWTSVRLWRPGLGLWTVPKGLWTLASDYTSVQPSAPNRRPPLSTTSYSRGKENRDTLMMENDKPRLPAGERSLQSGEKTMTAGCKGNWMDRMSHTDRRKSYVFMSRCYWKRKVPTQTVQTSLRNKNETDEILCRLKNSCFWHIRQKTASQLGAGAGEAHVWVYRWIQNKIWWIMVQIFLGSVPEQHHYYYRNIKRENMRRLMIQLTS